MASQPVWAMRIRDSANGPPSYAYRLAGYIKDAEYIWHLTRREYGPKGLPTVETIRAMQADHQRKREKFKKLSESYDPPPAKKAPEQAPEAESEPIRREPDPALQPDAITHARIIAHVADVFGMSRAELCTQGRKRRKVLARCVAARLLRNERWSDGRYRYSLPQIARMLGLTDHSTICYLLDVFGPYRRKYPEMKAAWKLLQRRLVE